MNYLADRSALSGTRLTTGGFLVSDACIARTGIQHYHASELGMTGDRLVPVYRPESSVKDAKALRGLSHAPVTLDHPPELVTSDNWEKYGVGEVSTEVEWVDNKLKIPLLVKDAAAISAIQGGKRELSVGYTCNLKFEDGVTPEGERYEAVQEDIEYNHVAIVQEGRAGSECRIGDSADNAGNRTNWAEPRPQQKESTMTFKAIVVGDQSVQVAVADADKAENQIKAMRDAHALAIADAKDPVAALEKQVGELTAKLAEAESELKAAKEASSPAQMDAAIKDRFKLISDAKSVHDADYDGMTPEQIKSTVVAAKFGDEQIKDKSAEFIDGMFGAALKAPATQSGGFAAAVQTRDHSAMNDPWSFMKQGAK